MPTVHIQQSRCASPRRHEIDYLKRSCRCQSVPSLTARVSRLTLHDANFAISSKGFSSIIPPSRGCPQPNKATKCSYLSCQTAQGSSNPVASTNFKNVNAEKKCATRAQTSQHRFVSPTRSSYRSQPASRYATNCALIWNKLSKNISPNDSEIAKKIENIYISERNVDYDYFSVQKEESLKRCGITNTSYQKYGKYDQLTNTDVETNPRIKNEASDTKTSPCSGFQRLHPDWRKVPWKPHFGWTNAHQELCKRLKQEIKKGSVESIYYTSEEEHAAAGGSCDLLGGPSVSSVSEALEVMRRMSAARTSWLYTGRIARRTRKATSGHSDYDADDED